MSTAATSPSPEPTPIFEGGHTASTSMSSAGSPTPTHLESFDWKDLEQRFQNKLMEFETEEAKVYEEFNDWLKLFQAWAATTTSHENERAIKRLRTRMTFVQGSEAKLDEKREHHQKVVEAFESALKLMENH